MRWLLAPVTVVAIAAAASASAQDSLCNPCVDPPIDRINRPDPFNNPYRRFGPTTVITDEEMRSLGVVSVADMVNQLRSAITAVDPEAVDGESQAEGVEVVDVPAETDADADPDASAGNASAEDASATAE